MIIVFSARSISKAQQLPEKYTETVVLDLKWGDGPNEVGLKKGKGLNYGPASFEVINNEIYILDSQNKRMLVYSEHGEYQRMFRVHGSGETCIMNGSILINNGFEREILVYDYQGDLLKEIVYKLGSNVYDLSIESFNEAIYLSHGIIQPDNSSTTIGTHGVRRFNSEYLPIEPEKHPRFIGRISGNIYKQKNDSSFDVIYSNGEKIGVINNYEDRESSVPMYLGEDYYGCLYFIVYNKHVEMHGHQAVRTMSDFVQIEKYYNNTLITSIGPINNKMYTEYEKAIMLTQNGEIYKIITDESGLRLMKWFKK